MEKIRNFAVQKIRKITGGKDPFKLIEESILSRKHDPDKCKQQSTAEFTRWMLPLENDQELEIFLDNPKKASDATIYLGVNVAVVSLRNALEVLTVALEIADGLIGVKLSLVGHHLVLSSYLFVDDLSAEDLEATIELLETQQKWFSDTLLKELGNEGGAD